MSEIKDHVTIPAKPAAVTAVNGAALGVAAVVTGGVAAGAAIAAGAVITAVVVKGRKEVGKAAARRASTPGAGGMRKAAAAKRAASSGSKGSSSKMGGGKKGATAGGKPSGLRAAVGRAMGGKKGAAAAGSKGTGSRGAGAGGTSGKPSWMRRGKSASPGASGTGSSSKAGKARKSPVAKAARKATKWAGGKVANGARKAVGLPTKPSPVTGKNRPGAGKVRSAFREKILGKGKVNPRTQRTSTNAATKNIKPSVNRKLVNDPPTSATTPISPAIIKPGRGPIATLTTPNGTAIHTPGGTMKDHARKMADDAFEFDAPGVLQIIDYLDDNLHDSLKMVAEAFDALSETSRNKWPFDDVIVQKLKATSECLWAAASMARGVVPDIEAIHAEELRKLRNPDRPGMEKFDLAANGKA